MIINHNMQAINAHRQLGINSTALAKSTEKLSSGKQINRAGDDAAGLSISEKMRAQIKGLGRATKNAQDGISYIQTAEGALDEVNAMLSRMKELGVQASTDTYSSDDKEAIELELTALNEEMTNIMETTEFNDINVFDKDTDIAISENGSTKLTIGKSNVGEALASLTDSIDKLKTDGNGIREIENGEKVTDVREEFKAVTDKYNTALSTYEGAVSTYEGAVSTHNGHKATYDTAKDDYETAKDVYEAAKDAYDAIKAASAGDTSGDAAWQTAKTNWTTAQGNWTTAQNTYEPHKNTFDADQKTFDKAKEKFETAKSTALEGISYGDGFMDSVEDTIKSVNSQRAVYGSLQNRLEHTINNLNVTNENLTSAESRIRDTDMAKEMMNFTKTNVLNQAAQSMMAQANQLPNQVLSILG